MSPASKTSEISIVFSLQKTNLLAVYVQVNNTDAEGRLTLADALVYACNQGVDKVLSEIYCSFVDT